MEADVVDKVGEGGLDVILEKGIRGDPYFEPNACKGGWSDWNKSNCGEEKNRCGMQFKKYEIIESMGLRLTLEKSEATKKLKEHEIYNQKTKRHELRFRVDNFGNNIHCLYRKKENIVEFVNYFSSGKHDDYKKKN